jgi:DNA-binding MarR family transcriptional regulator
LTAGEVAKTLGYTPSNATKLLKQVKEFEHLVRPSGERTAASARAVLDELNGHLADGFTPSELQTVSRWLAHAANTLPPDG